MVGPRPRRKDYYARAITGKYFRQQAYDDAVGAWERKRDEEREERIAARTSRANRTVCPMCTRGFVYDEDKHDTVACDACGGDGFIEA